MKEDTLHSLIMARTLYDEAIALVESSDSHLCSAGLIILQDALEIMFLACLKERGVDEQKSLENKGFDELIGELKTAGITIPKSGTLKALNKQRVITKHYGQLAEPVTVRGYAEAAAAVVEALFPQALGRSLHDIFLFELLGEGEAREFLANATSSIESGQYFNALIDIRKAIFVEIEIDYSIHGWDDQDPLLLSLRSLLRGGIKAPSFTRDKKWIEDHVKDPMDYIQIDHERLRLEAMEWGVNTAELENLRRLTPGVFRADKDTDWKISYDIETSPDNESEQNAKYCLNRTISILLRKQAHERKRQYPERGSRPGIPESYIGSPVYEKATRKSKVIHKIEKPYEYNVSYIVSGFDPSERYYSIFGRKRDALSALGMAAVFGYLLIHEGEPLLADNQTSEEN